MAQQRRFLDVWIVELNTVYREVPFTVICDWVQQGRLLGDDRVKASGTQEWGLIGESPEFSPYLPRPAAHSAEDEAEALEPVRLDFGWKRPRGEEDEDVDMIPLIDVSLVLLVFFMITATGVGSGGDIPTPPTHHGNVKDDPNLLWVGIERKGEDDNTPVYSVGEGRAVIAQNLASKDEALAKLKEHLDIREESAEVTIKAHPDVASGHVRDVLADLGSTTFRAKVRANYIGVSEKTP